MRIIRVATVLTLGAAAVVAAAPPAAADNPICRVVQVGGDALHFRVCSDVHLNVGDTTLAPSVTRTCSLSVFGADPGVPCDQHISVGETGFVPNPSPPTPVVDASNGFIRVPDGSLGTLYVDGESQDVPIVGFCIGDDAFCS